MKPLGQAYAQYRHHHVLLTKMVTSRIHHFYFYHISFAVVEVVQDVNQMLSGDGHE